MDQLIVNLAMFTMDRTVTQSRRWTRATCCITRIVLYREIDAQRVKLAKMGRRSNVNCCKYIQVHLGLLVSGDVKMRFRFEENDLANK